MSLLEYDIIRKEQVNELLNLKLELNIRREKEYKVEAIKNSTIYITKTIVSQLSGLYYLVS